jgi:hypothetical protein
MLGTWVREALLYPYGSLDTIGYNPNPAEVAPLGTSIETLTTYDHSFLACFVSSSREPPRRVPSSPRLVTT